MENDHRFESEMQELLDIFKLKISKLANEVIHDFYTDVAPYAYGDALTNFRNALLQDIVSREPSCLGYKNKEIRAQIFEEHKEVIIKQINRDIFDQLQSLKTELKIQNDRRYPY